MTKHERPWLGEATAAVGETLQQGDPTAPTPAATSPLEDVALPEDMKLLAAVLQELTVILPGLKAALERKPSVERLTYRIEDVAASLGMSRRAIERERSAGRFPAPDLHFGKAPLWRPATVREWLDRGGRPL
jgi:hypothetical protein